MINSVWWSIGATARCWIVAAWLGVPLAAAADVPWPELRLPPGARSGQVTEETRINGLPMRMRVFSTEQTAAEVAAYYKRAWSGQPGLRVVGPQPMGDTLRVMAEGDRFNRVLEVKGGSKRSHGTLSVMDKARADPGQAAPDFNVPNGLERVVSQEDSDGSSLILAGKLSPSAELDRVVTALRDQGWSLTKKRRARSRASAVIAYMEGNGGGIQIVADRDGNRSLVLINRLK